MQYRIDPPRGHPPALSYLKMLLSVMFSPRGSPTRLSFLRILFSCSRGVCSRIRPEMQSSWKHLFSFFLKGLGSKGVPLIASRILDRTLRLPGSEPFRDILSEGGWSSQRGMDVWRLAGVALLLFRPLLTSEANLVSLVVCLLFAPR